MSNKDTLNSQQIVQYARLQAWAMSKICALLSLCVLAAATRIPLYLAAADYGRLIGVILFGLLVLAGVIANIHTHIYLWRHNKNI